MLRPYGPRPDDPRGSSAGRLTIRSIHHPGQILVFTDLTDRFRHAAVLYVLAIGVIELLVEDRLDLTECLEIHDPNDFKNKPIGAPMGG